MLKCQRFNRCMELLDTKVIEMFQEVTSLVVVSFALREIQVRPRPDLSYLSDLHIFIKHIEKYA